MRAGLIVYGAPAAGKSTLTAELCRQSAAFVRHRPVKCGPGRTEGYRMVTPVELEAIRADPRDVVWEQERYGAVYVVRRSCLVDLPDGEVPVVELGQPAAVRAVVTNVPEVRWHVVELRCGRDTAAARIRARETGDEAERLGHYDATPALPSADLVVDTGSTPSREVARIAAAVVLEVEGSR